jgi:hypothetical protein
MSWSSFTRLRKKHAAILLRPDVANCIKLGLLTFDHIIYSNKQRRKKLRLKQVVALLVKQVITLQDMDTLTVSKCKLLNKNLLLRQSLCQGIISLTEFNLRSLKPLYTTIFANRLKAAFYSQPYHLYDEKPDTAASLLSEIPAAESYAEFSPGELQKNVVNKIIHYLKLEIQHVYFRVTDYHTKPLHRRLLGVINTLDRENATPEACLARIIEAANQNKEQPLSSGHFFGKYHPDADEFNHLCCQLNTLRCFTESPAAKPTVTMKPTTA